jgi:hypothetical protein
MLTYKSTLTKVNFYINIQKIKKDDAKFTKDFDSGYEEFKIGEMLKQARVEVGLTKRVFIPSLRSQIVTGSICSNIPTQMPSCKGYQRG